jgi:hypothetical protein
MPARKSAIRSGVQYSGGSTMTQNATERNRMQLGLFMPNCSYAYSISTYKPDPLMKTLIAALIQIARAILSL